MGSRIHNGLVVFFFMFGLYIKAHLYLFLRQTGHERGDNIFDFLSCLLILSCDICSIPWPYGYSCSMLAYGGSLRLSWPVAH